MTQSSQVGASLSAKLAELTRPSDEIGESLLASATYDGDRRKAVLKFYDQKAGRFWLWEDNTGHRPYCYTRQPLAEIEFLRKRKDVDDIVEEERADLLNDTRTKVRKIITKDPLAIGGGNDSIRDQIKAWEADIKYYENFTYDRGLRMGTYYRVSGGKVLPIRHEVPERVNESLREVTKRNPAEFQPYLRDWAELLSEPLADFRRVALDIEVDNEEGRLPDVEDPKQPVVAVSFFNESEKLVYLLKGKRDEKGLDQSPFAYQVFDDEAELLRAVFSKILDYPVIVSFNGDDFDLRYLRHRAESLGIGEEEDPIQLERVAASLKHGIHIDLYQFFRNRSIQVYAFGNRYTEHTLNAISESLLNKSKIEFEGEIGDLPLGELGRYCLNDSQLTYELTSMMGSVVMKLLLVISRIGKMPMNDVSRLGVSNWIRSLLFFEHRKLGALIPRQDELTEKGGGSTQAVIKGKKYKGGFVIEPKPGAYFDVSVLDFASLYPSLIKIHNLSYETVNCPHPECRSNKVPDTSSWVCTKRKGIVSLVTGSLRDLRVAHYKPLTKDPSLSRDDRDLYNVVTQGLKVFLNACFTGDTLVVTPQGIRNIKEMKVGDEVVSVNPETLIAEIDRVIEVQAFQYKGDLIHFRDPRFVDLMVTPNHRMLTIDHRKSSKSHTFFRTAEEVSRLTNMAIPKLNGGVVDKAPPSKVSLLETAKSVGANANVYPENWMRLINWFRRLPEAEQQKIHEFGKVCKYWSKKRSRLESHYRVPAVYMTEEDIDMIEAAGGRVLVGGFRSAQIPVRYDAVEFASACGWFVSEGSPHMNEPKTYENGNVRGRAAALTISQGHGGGNPRGKEFRGEIRDLLDRLGLPHVQDSGDNEYFQATSSVLYEWMVSHCYADGEPHNAASKVVPSFVFESNQTMRAFLDSVYKGDGNKKGNRYSTKSARLAEGLVVLTTMLGMKAKMKFDGEAFRVTFKNVSSKLTFAGSEATKHLKRVPFEGTVYCVTTERNHTVVAGRNGRFTQVGQSYGVLGFETFAFYCLPVAEATAALGRDAITKTIAKCKELGIDVLYGDSITAERCVALLDPLGMFRILPIEDFFSVAGHYQERSDGKLEAHPVQWRALSVNPQTGKVDFKQILAVIRHKTKKKIFRVRERWGVTRVTEDHSLLARTEGGFVFAKPTALDGKETVRVGRIPDLKEIKEIDLYQEIKNITFESTFKGREKTATVRCDNDWVWFGWQDRAAPTRVKRRYLEGTPEFESLIDLLAAYVPEGSSSTPAATQTRVGASIANSDTEWLAHLRECYLALFDRAKAAIIRSDRGERRLQYPTSSGMVETVYEDRTHKLQMMNQLAAVFFKGLGGQGSKGKKIPDFVFHLSPEYKRRFLEGLVKGDGSRWVSDAYTEEYAKKNFRYESASLLLVSGLSLLLTSLGTGHIVNYRPSKDTYVISTSSQYNSRDTLKVTEEEYSGYVYDLSVADYHTFVDACGGIVLKNTDSLFLRSPSKEQVQTITRWADTNLGIELDLDKVYRYVAFSSRKKNYFGVLPDGVVDIRGLTGKKSVDGSTPMVARIDGVQQLTTVGRAFGEFRGGKKVEVVSITDGMRTVWVPISDATKHEVSDVYRVVTSKGRDLCLSGDHSVFLIDPMGRLRTKKTREVKQGDVLVGARLIQPTDTPVQVDTVRLLATPTVQRGELLYSALAHSTTGVPIPRRIEVTEQFARLLGIYVAEGSSSSRRDQRDNVISQDRVVNREVCDAIEESWNRTFGWDIHFQSRDGSKGAYYLPMLYGELFRTCCGAGSGTKMVPSFLFSCPRPVVREFLRGYFSGGGHSNSKRISASSKSEALVVGIAHLLSYFDIDCRVRRRYDKAFRRYHHHLSIIGTSSRQRFMAEIGVLQERSQGYPRSTPRNKELIPVSTDGLLAVKQAILLRRGKATARHLNFHHRRRYNLSLLRSYNRTVKQLWSLADVAEKGQLLKITRMINSQDVAYDEVVSVRRLRGPRVMYDFSVPGLERFVAGNLPTLLHNSQTPEYLKKVFYETLEILSSVKTPEDFERARADTRSLLTRMISDIKGKKVPVNDLAFTVMMGKPTGKYNGTTPQHVRAAMQLEERGKEVKAGEIIAYVKTKNPPYVKPAELARSDEVDADKYIEYAHSMFDQLLDALDFSFDEIMGATTLDLFWGG